MNRQVTGSVLLLSMMLAGGLGSKCTRRSAGGPPEVTGGPCTYEKYPGTITVTDVRYEKRAPARKVADEPEPESVTLTVEFNGTAPYPAGHVITTIEVTPSQAKEKGVKKGQQYRGYSMYIKSGTCYPGPSLADFKDWN
jgi:hypothetical protein